MCPYVPTIVHIMLRRIDHECILRQCIRWIRRRPTLITRCRRLLILIIWVIIILSTIRFFIILTCRHLIPCRISTSMINVLFHMFRTCCDITRNTTSHTRYWLGRIMDHLTSCQRIIVHQITSRACPARMVIILAKRPLGPSIRPLFKSSLLDYLQHF